MAQSSQIAILESGINYFWPTFGAATFGQREIEVPTLNKWLPKHAGAPVPAQVKSPGVPDR